MRRPSHPPPPRIGDPKVVEFLSTHADWMRQVNARYFSWDEMRRRPIPGGASAETAWSAVQISRAIGARPLPLLDKRGAPFKVFITDRILEWLLEAEGAAADPLGLSHHSPSDQRRYLVGSLYEEAIHSSLLEGALTTRAAAKRMLREGRKPRDHSEQMIVNNFRAVEMLADMADGDLTPEAICVIHRSITVGTLDDPNDAGRVQQPGEERVKIVDRHGDVVHQPPPAEELEERLQRLCEFANASQPFLPVLVRASLVHFQLAYDHPFVDGNGRTARALFYWMMIRADHRLVRYLSISRVIFGSKRQYERAYLNVQQTGDASYFVHYHTQVYRKAIDALADYLAHRRREAKSAEQALRRWVALNPRQKHAVRKSLDDDTLLWTTRVHGSEHSVTLPTARADLRGLAAVGLLEARQSGRRLWFVSPSDLEERVAQGPQEAGSGGPDPHQGALFR